MKARAGKGLVTESGDASSRNGSPTPDQDITPGGEEDRRGRKANLSSRSSTKMKSRSRSASKITADQTELTMGTETPIGEAEKAAKDRGETGKARRATHHSRMRDSEEIRDGSGKEGTQSDGTFVEGNEDDGHIRFMNNTMSHGRLQPMEGDGERTTESDGELGGMLATFPRIIEGFGTLSVSKSTVAQSILPIVHAEEVAIKNNRKLATEGLDGEKVQASENNGAEDMGGATPLSEASKDSSIIFSNSERQQQQQQQTVGEERKVR